MHLLYSNFLYTITYFAASRPEHCGPRSLHSSVQGGGFLVAAWAHLLALGGRVHQDLLVGAGYRGDVPGLGAGRGQAEAAVLPPPRLQVPHHPPVADAEIEAGEARAQPEYHQQRTCDRTTQYYLDRVDKYLLARREMQSFHKNKARKIHSSTAMIHQIFFLSISNRYVQK